MMINRAFKIGSLIASLQTDRRRRASALRAFETLIEGTPDHQRGALEAERWAGEQSPAANPAQIALSLGITLDRAPPPAFPDYHAAAVAARRAGRPQNYEDTLASRKTVFAVAARRPE